MRVEAYNQVMQIYGKQKTNKVNSTSAASSAKDALELSEFGHDLQTAKKAVADAQDVREDLTAPLKAKIDAGTYDVSGESFADKLMAKIDELA